MAKRKHANDSRMQEMQKNSTSKNDEQKPGYGDKKLEGPNKPSV